MNDRPVNPAWVVLHALGTLCAVWLTITSTTVLWAAFWAVFVAANMYFLIDDIRKLRAQNG